MSQNKNKKITLLKQKSHTTKTKNHTIKTKSHTTKTKSHKIKTLSHTFKTKIHTSNTKSHITKRKCRTIFKTKVTVSKEIMEPILNEWKWLNLDTFQSCCFSRFHAEYSFSLKWWWSSLIWILVEKREEIVCIIWLLLIKWRRERKRSKWLEY